MPCLFPVAAVFVGLASPSDAYAQRVRGFILVTWGETISHIDDVKTPERGRFGANKVGYKSGYFGVFWIDLWTWGGEYCLYEGDRYRTISPSEAARLVRKKESELGIPFLYQVPLGWLIFGPPIIVVAIVAALKQVAALKNGDGNDVTLLFQDTRYRRALEILDEHPADQPAPAPPSDASGSHDSASENTRFHSAFEAGVRHLIASGIPREEAERNLAIMIPVRLFQLVFQAQQQQAATGASGGTNPVLHESLALEALKAVPQLDGARQLLAELKNGSLGKALKDVLLQWPDFNDGRRKQFLARADDCAMALRFARSAPGRRWMNALGYLTGTFICVAVWGACLWTFGTNLGALQWVGVVAAGLIAGSSVSYPLWVRASRRWIETTLIPEIETAGISPDWLLAVLERGGSPSKTVYDDLADLRELAPAIRAALTASGKVVNDVSFADGDSGR